MDYVAVKLIHQSAVALSIAGFFVRGAASLAGAAWVDSRGAKTFPHIVDSVLLLSGVSLMWLMRLTPERAPWLLAKWVGLLIYIVLGVIALRRTQPRRVRLAAWLGALLVVAWIVSVAIFKRPLGFIGA